jgi:hypothetical protein
VQSRSGQQLLEPRLDLLPQRTDLPEIRRWH